MSAAPEVDVVRLLSVGGVVVRPGSSGLEVALCGQLRGDGLHWRLPKGTPEPGETREETAIREVTEETGLEVAIDAYVDKIEYSFAWPYDGVQYGGSDGDSHKTVHFYLMSATGGDVALHDDEFDEVRWFHTAEAPGVMKFENEARIVERGAAMVREEG